MNYFTVTLNNLIIHYTDNIDSTVVGIYLHM